MKTYDARDGVTVVDPDLSDQRFILLTPATNILGLTFWI